MHNDRSGVWFCPAPLITKQRKDCPGFKQCVIEILTTSVQSTVKLSFPVSFPVQGWPHQICKRKGAEE